MVYCQIKWAFCTFQAFRSFFRKIAFANSTGSVSQLSEAINFDAEGLRLKITKPLLVLWSFNNSAVYPYTGGLKLVPMLNVSSLIFLTCGSGIIFDLVEPWLDIKLVWHVFKAYQKAFIRSLPYPNSGR